MSLERQSVEEAEELVLEEKEKEKEKEEEEGEERSTSTTSSSSGRRGRRRRRRREAMRLDRILPKGSLRVLLLEGDDSTRHVIAALLRKCNYKVAAVSDGLKAWEILKERPHSIDVILAEVELPSISGINLLSMIMDHESCKNIPVIMMSSHDSINMVFNCMLKGAADFLVKPVRKNELRNLWQHVWRKHIISGGHGSTIGHDDDNVKNMLEANPSKEKKSGGFLSPLKNNMECSEKESDAESSCRRSDMQAESTYKQNSMEPPQTKCRGLSLFNDTVCQNGEEKIRPKMSLLDGESKDEDRSDVLGSKGRAFNEKCMAKEQLLEQEHIGTLVQTTNEMENQTCDQSAPPKQIIDLIGAIDNQGQFGYGLEENTASSNSAYNATEAVFCGEDFSCKSSSLPLLELSLRRYPYGSVDKEKKKEGSMLNHSNSSPFSLYNSRAPVSTSKTVNLPGETEECCTPTKPIPTKVFGSSSNALTCNGTVRYPNVENAESTYFGASNGNAFKCSPIRVAPMAVPVVGMSFDLGAGCHSGLQSIFVPNTSSHLSWSPIHAKWQEVVCTNSSCQSDTKDSYSSHQDSHNQAWNNPILYQIEHVNTEPGEEVCHVASVTGESVNGRMHHSGASQVEGNGHGRIFVENSANNMAAKINHVTAELQHQEQGLTELHRLSHREEALNKFRLKRKDRCFEKKVRYESRKRLAEQRPRVKGQFVRHIQPDAHVLPDAPMLSTEVQMEQAVG